MAKKAFEQKMMQKKNPVSLHYLFFHSLFHPPPRDCGAAVFHQTQDDKETYAGSRGILAPQKCVGCKAIILQESVCVQANYTLHSLHYTGPEQHHADSLMMLSEALPVIFQAACFGSAEPGLFDKTTSPSPLIHTHKEQKVSTPRRASRCSRLRQ